MSTVNIVNQRLLLWISNHQRPLGQKDEDVRRMSHQQKLFFASRASCASDAWDAPDVNRDSRANVGSAVRPDAIPPVTLRPGAILTSIPCFLDVLIPPNSNPLHPDALESYALSS